VSASKAGWSTTAAAVTATALVGGFLARRLAGDDLAAALEYGVATAAVARTLDGDMPLVSPADVEAVVDGDADLSR
jgi:2-dehydro-3-deoxygluconokinase